MELYLLRFLMECLDAAVLDWSSLNITSGVTLVSASLTFPLEQQSLGHCFSYFWASKCWHTSAVLPMVLSVLLNNFWAVSDWKVAFSQFISVTAVCMVVIRLLWFSEVHHLDSVFFVVTFVTSFSWSSPLWSWISVAVDPTSLDFWCYSINSGCLNFFFFFFFLFFLFFFFVGISTWWASEMVPHKSISK